MLETKIQWLEINVEVNGICGNNITLLWIQNSANTWLISTNKTTKTQEVCVPGNKSTSGSPPWNSLGAKPKSKSFPWEMGGRVTGRAQCPEICEATSWPALSSRQSASSTPFSVGQSRGQLQKGELTTNLPNNQVCNWRTDLHYGRTLILCLMTWITSHLHTVG